MSGLLDAPVFVVVAFTLASALLLVEVALPTVGLAGASGLGLAAAGAVALARQDEPWWPLLLVALAVCLWAVQLARRSASPRTQEILAVPVQSQAVITKDNVTATVDAVAYFQVVDPVASVVKIRDWYTASQLVAQTTPGRPPAPPAPDHGGDRRRAELDDHLSHPHRAVGGGPGRRPVGRSTSSRLRNRLLSRCAPPAPRRARGG